MSVKIEILDYKYSEIEGTQMISNYSFASSADWYLGAGWTISGGSANHSGGNGYLEQNNLNFIQGQTYRIKYKISGRTLGSLILANHLAGNANGFIQNNNGAFSYDWVQGSNNNDKLSLAGWNNFDGSVEYVQVFIITGIDWENSILGELDVTDHSDFPLAMTFQISDFKDLTSTSGDYSKTFKFPATKNNNNILKHLYIPNINSDNDVTERKPCRIMMGDAYTLLGLIRITGTGGYGEVPSYYSGVFYGNNLTWASGLEDAYMNDLDWGVDGEDLEYKQSSIIDTWQHEDSDNSSNSPIVYPITSYGQYNEEGDARTIQLLGQYANYSASYYGYNSSGTFHGTPKPVADWRPAVFVKNTLDKLFGSVGYKISSAFMDTAEFKKNVWLLPNFKYNNPDDRFKLLSYGNRFTGQGLVGSFTASSFASTTYKYTSFFPNLNDAGADFVLNTNTDNVGWDSTVGSGGGHYTAQEYGNYTIKSDNFGLYFDNWINSPNSFSTVDYVRLSVQVQTVGHSSWVDISYVQSPQFVVSYGTTASQTGSVSLPSFDSAGFQTYLNKGDKIRLKVSVKMKTNGYVVSSLDFHLFGSSTPTSATTSSSANGQYTIAINPNIVEYGQTYNLTDVMNPDYKQIDFIKGIAHSYNLQMTTDESTKTVYIEPFDSFYKPYKDAIDWTSKLSRADEITDKWIENDLKRSLVFKYKSDSADAKVKFRGETYFDDVEDEYPYRETLPDTFEKGDSTFENPFFAGTYNAKDTNTTGIPNVDTAYSACLWKENYSSNDVGRPDKGFEFLPRLLYWNKYSPVVGSGTKVAKVQTWSTITKWITADASASSIYNISTIYPQATMLNRDSTTSPNLAYGNAWVRDYDDATGIYTASQTGKGLYDTYYRNMIEMLKINPRLRTISLDLKVSDIINLDFRELVYIDGVYWRINRIVDYMPNNNNTTKVELIEWSQIGIFAASAPTFGSSGGSSSWGTGGSYTQSTSAEAEPPSGF